MTKVDQQQQSQKCMTQGQTKHPLSNVLIHKIIIPSSKTANHPNVLNLVISYAPLLPQKKSYAPLQTGYHLQAMVSGEKNSIHLLLYCLSWLGPCYNDQQQQIMMVW